MACLQIFHHQHISVYTYINIRTVFYLKEFTSKTITTNKVEQDVSRSHAPVKQDTDSCVSEESCLCKPCSRILAQAGCTSLEQALYFISLPALHEPGAFGSRIRQWALKPQIRTSDEQASEQDVEQGCRIFPIRLGLQPSAWHP